LPVGINFDCANPVMVGYDPIAILRAVADRVWHVHVSDRKVGDYAHQVLGEGDVPLEAIFRELAGRQFHGVLSLEDGQGPSLHLLESQCVWKTGKDKVMKGHGGRWLT
ncbi:MAG: hypothetical protein HZLCBSQH_002349, partial [Candidatus Fervidibacterota bacterium]